MKRFKKVKSGIIDANTGLIWSREKHPRLNWQKAVEYCAKLDENGKNDWRLPAIDELETIINRNMIEPSIPKELQEICSVVSGGYWSSTSYVGNTSDAWGVSLRYGDVDYDFKANNFYVWPVRDIPKKIKPIEKLYGVIHDGHRIPAQVHHSLDRLKKVNGYREGYKIVEYKLNESKTDV